MNLTLQIEHWLSAHKKKFKDSNRPFVTLSYAQSWDGSITTKTGTTLSLSGEKSTRLTHHLRSLHDGILVGIGTVLADDPLLNVRQCPGPSPQPIILDSKLRMPSSARLCTLIDKKCWVLTTKGKHVEPSAGLEIITVPADCAKRVDLTTAMLLLRNRGINSLLVEGGANVISAFLKAKLVDVIVLTIAPTLVGGYKAITDLGLMTKQQLPRIAPLYTEHLDDDLIMWGNLHYSESESAT
jgi:diaminohydroxyphosphoribosylaminopyrimidine deaminase / 5-amino-6-(5-phosphoribosylamino)uracil reductase